MEDAHDDSQENSPNLNLTKSMFIQSKGYKFAKVLNFPEFCMFISFHSNTGPHLGSQGGGGGSDNATFLHST